jgi:hypothetical protein
VDSRTSGKKNAFSGKNADTSCKKAPDLCLFFTARKQLGACVNLGSKAVIIHHNTCITQQLGNSVVGKHRQHVHIIEGPEALSTATQYNL